MRLGVIAATLLGLALAAWLIVSVGIAPVLSAVARVGIGGFAILCAYALGLVAVLAAGWRMLVPGGARFSTFLIGRQIRDSASDVLPFSQLGGIVIGARATILRGLDSSTAFASAIADVTTELMAELVFIAAGIALCLTQLRLAPVTAPLAKGLIVGLALMVPGIGAFIALQRRGGRMAASLSSRWLPAAVGRAEAFHRRINELYRDRSRLALSSAIHLLGWIGSGAGTWIMLTLMGAHIALTRAIGIEALMTALRSAFVFVPSALGVQEIGYATLLPLFGVPPEIGLGASLLKRAREIAIGVPVLLAWQLMEGRRAFAGAELGDAK
ncbi:MAG: flippase-like domain-containing protein [Alphaproteobacteria bacterium]|nr:flippase-like domain-containing protein [Alphaproteobacteria bacterium]